MPFAGCQYCTNRCHCSPGRLILRPYPIDQQNKPFLDPDVDVKTENKLETSSAIQPSRDHPSGIQLCGKFFESFAAKISPYISCKVCQQNQMAKNILRYVRIRNLFEEYSKSCIWSYFSAMAYKDITSNNIL